MDEEEQHREVYAQYGLNMQLVQVLEHAIANAMVLFDLVPEAKGRVTSVEEWQRQFDAYMLTSFEKTLGALVTRIQSAAPIPDSLVSSLRECNAKRNFLAHRFFRERAEKFLSESGRSHMLSELREIQMLLENTIDLFEQTTKLVWQRYGFSDERRQIIYEEYISQLKGE